MDEIILFSSVSQHRENKRLIINDHKATVTKSILFFSFLIFVSLNTNSGFLNYSAALNGNCIYDSGLKLIEPINRFFHSEARDYIVILSSFLMDYSAVVTCLIWIFEAKTWGFIFNMGIFFGLRSFIQHLYIMPFPFNNFFFPTGFPSLMVNYIRTPDFFYSGHIGFHLICAFELKDLGYSLMTYLNLLFASYQFFIVMITSSHYTVDVIWSVIIACWIVKNTSKLINSLDDTWLKMKDNQC